MEEKVRATEAESQEQRQRVQTYEAQLVKQSSQLADLHALEEELETIKSNKSDGDQDSRTVELEEQIEKERKAAGRAAEEKAALMEMIGKLNEDVSTKEELVQQLKKELQGLKETSAAAGGTTSGSGAGESEKDARIEELEAKVKKVMVDAKRVIEKYKVQEEEHKTKHDALVQEVASLKEGGAHAAPGGGGAELEELEMQVTRERVCGTVGELEIAVHPDHHPHPTDTLQRHSMQKIDILRAFFHAGCPAQDEPCRFRRRG